MSDSTIDFWPLLRKVAITKIKEKLQIFKIKIFDSG